MKEYKQAALDEAGLRLVALLGGRDRGARQKGGQSKMTCNHGSEMRQEETRRIKYIPVVSFNIIRYRLFPSHACISKFWSHQLLSALLTTRAIVPLRTTQLASF